MVLSGVKDRSLIFQYFKITWVVTLYWFVSISMVFINKKLLGGSSMQDNDVPFFVTAFQCCVTSLSCLTLSKLSDFIPWVTFPKMVMEKQKALEIFPLSVVFVSMMLMNNLCLKYVGVAFYFVGRSLSTVFNVIFTYLILGEKTSFATIVCCAVIISGFVLGIDQEGDAGSLSVIGVIFGVLASMAVSLNAIFTKKVLPTLDGSIWLLTFYNNVMAVCLFIPIIVIAGELPAILRMCFEGSLNLWGLLLISGWLGLSIGYVSSLQIKVTSPLTHMISGTAKACAQTVLANWWFNDPKAWLWWLSNWVVLGGSMAYTRVKQLSLKNEHAKNNECDEEIDSKESLKSLELNTFETKSSK